MEIFAGPAFSFQLVGITGQWFIELHRNTEYYPNIETLLYNGSGSLETNHF